MSRSMKKMKMVDGDTMYFTESQSKNNIERSFRLAPYLFDGNPEHKNGKKALRREIKKQLKQLI